MNPYLIFVLVVLVAAWLLDLVVELLNLRHLQPELPEEFADTYDADTYRRSQQYTREKTRAALVGRTVNLAILLPFILLGGFDFVDQLVRGWTEAVYLRGLLFGGGLGFAAHLLGLPFEVHDTFVLEERYGFNKTTPKIFVLDQIKGLLLALLIGAPVFAGLMWFFRATGDFAWLYAWVGLTVVQLLISFLAPATIMRLFNKFEPLQDEELKRRIKAYAEKESFPLREVYQIDASMRTTKSNAFFTGFGRFRRVALYDNLLEKHDHDELLVILAHEIGHYKLKHIPIFIVMAIVQTGLLMFVVGFFMQNERLFDAFAMSEPATVYASLIFVSFLFSPINLLISAGTSAVSRRFEFQADRFAVRTCGPAEAMVRALKKLARDNLSNLTPHPLKVALEYSHPPLLERIRHLRRLSDER